LKIPQVKREFQGSQIHHQLAINIGKRWSAFEPLLSSRLHTV